jgi:uncharacterized protein (DUF342 family)
MDHFEEERFQKENMDSEDFPEKNGAGYCLEYHEEGVFFSFCSQNEGFNKGLCLMQLKRKGFDASAIGVAQTFMESGGGEPVRISEPCSEKILDEEARVLLEESNMKATLTLLPPDPGGALLSKEKLLAVVREEYGIVFGTDEDTIGRLLENREYGRPALIACGREAKNGEDGEITFHFSIKKNIRNVLREKEDGRIDFRDACKIENVLEGQLLVSRKLAGAGTDGMDVRGKKITAKKGKEAAMPSGKNVVLSEDKNALYAKMGGVASLQFGKVVVSPVYTVNGDVDMAVGNIDFDGDVLITGNVNSGFFVRADGSVTVNGVVEDAHIESGGDIVLKRGIQGADKGTLHAGGSIYALFIQRADAQAEVKICAGYILHSKVSCEGTVELTDEKGMLVGGVTDAGKGLRARIIGAESGIQTIVNIGASPKKRERYLKLKEMLQQARNNVERLDTALKSTVGTLSAANMEVRMEITKKLLALKKEEKRMAEEYEELRMEIAHTAEECVHVLEKIFPGTRVSIGNNVYQVRTEESAVTLCCREGRITAEPCNCRDKGVSF